jgi:hypothetical protein
VEDKTQALPLTPEVLNSKAKTDELVGKTTFFTKLAIESSRFYF